MEHLLQQKNKYYVYALSDSSGIPFYVGKGHGNRMYDHESKVRNGIIPHHNKHLFYKIQKIILLEGCIVYKKLHNDLCEADALKLEMEEIKKFGRSVNGSGKLCNLTSGGEGISGLKHSVSTKKRMSEKRKLWTSVPENKKTLSEQTRKAMYSSGYVDRVSKEITLLSPSQEIVIAKNISKFCRDNNLQNGNLYKVLRGKIKSHKGWTLPKG